MKAEARRKNAFCRALQAFSIFAAQRFFEKAQRIKAGAADLFRYVRSLLCGGGGDRFSALIKGEREGGE